MGSQIITKYSGGEVSVQRTFSDHVTLKNIETYDDGSGLVKDEFNLNLKEAIQFGEDILKQSGSKRLTTSDLVNFGNYLFSRYGNMVYSSDGTNTPLYKREVSHADLCNWSDLDNVEIEGESYTKYPSRYAIGDKVKVFLMPEDEEYFPGFNATIIAVHFTNSKVKYDLEIKFAGDFTSRIYNVDSILVTDRKQ